MLNHLIIGQGQVGTSLCKYLVSKKQSVQTRDKTVRSCKACTNSCVVCTKIDEDKCDILHICYGYSNNFIKYSKEYIKQYKPKYVIIHSTVPVGTSKKLKAVHSPIRGIHPHLEKSIGIFTKFFGGKIDDTLEKWIELTFNRSVIIPNSNVTEAVKIWSTTQYGLSIILEKEIHKYCKKHKLPFDIIYTLANQTYNDGYEELGYSQFNRPVLEHIPGKIGGHCIIPNCKLLNNDISKIILKENNKYK